MYVACREPKCKQKLNFPEELQNLLAFVHKYIWMLGFPSPDRDYRTQPSQQSKPSEAKDADTQDYFCQLLLNVITNETTSIAWLQ